MTTTTKQSRLTEALLNGEQLTAAQIAARFDIKNPTATISDIRFSGIPVYANRSKTGKTFYRTGKASRVVVAAGYRALAMGLFTQE
jgi:predicted DNA-binding transcriptional regulator YafY